MNEVEILGKISERKELIPLIMNQVRAGHPVDG